MSTNHTVVEVKWNGVNEKPVTERVVKAKLSKGKARELADKLNRKQDHNEGEILSYLVRTS
jgi:hypothetical protein